MKTNLKALSIKEIDKFVENQEQDRSSTGYISKRWKFCATGKLGLEEISGLM